MESVGEYIENELGRNLNVQFKVQFNEQTLIVLKISFFEVVELRSEYF